MSSPRIALLALLLAGGGIAGCAASELVRYRLCPDHPRSDDATLPLEGLGQGATIYLDRAGVPHIDAADERDLLFAIGFAQGRERFFGMDTLRRVARGTLSELVGEQPMMDSSTVEFDLTMRGWGFERLAAADVREVEPEMQPLLEAYVAGVNAALARHRPLEYRLLEVEPEPWSLHDSFAVGRLNAWSVSHNWSQELVRLLLALHGGVDRAEQLYPSAPWPGEPALASTGEPRPLPPAIADELRALFPPRPPVLAAAPGLRPARAPQPVDGASNAWVVGGGRSRSGRPLLASDPHLTHFLPSLMFQQHIRAPGLEAIGVTLAGVPYVLMGHTRQVAWGMTSAVADVIDLCVERPHPDDPAQVLTPDGWRALERSEQVIRVRVGQGFEERRRVLRRSPNGPLLNDLYPGLLPAWAPPIAVRWDTTGTGRSLAAMRASNRARSVEELRQAVSSMVTPINNYLAADVHGTVAMFANGKLPRRAHHLGTFAVPGWLAEYQWTGYVDFDEMPLGSGRDQAFFAHGNTLLWDPARSPYIYQVDSAPSYRRDRIVDGILAQPQHDLASFAQLQRDVVLYRARRILPHLLVDLEGLPEPSPRERRARELLGQWDLVASVDSAATPIFWETYRQAAIAGSVDEVAPEVLPFVLGQRYYSNAVDLWFDRVDHPAWDDRRTAATEDRTQVVRAAFRAAVAELRRALGPDPARWRWGQLHALQPRHLMGGVPLLADLVNLERIELGGGPDSVWKTHFDLKQGPVDFAVNAGPVYRMLIDMADPDHGLWIVDTGSSGWPGSPHYGDQYQRAARGAYLPMVMDWAEIQRDAAGRLQLVRPGA